MHKMKEFACCRDGECKLVRYCPRKGNCGKDQKTCLGNIQRSSEGE